MEKSRRVFIKKSALSTAVISFAGAGTAFSAQSYRSILGANDRINMAVIGIRGQGFGHIRRWAGMAKDNNVFLKTICDVDENLFAERQKAAEELQGKKPTTEWDMRKVFEDKEIDAISIASPNHWHALTTIWAVQAGKDVYVEKPCCHNVFEGRKMIEAARKYNQIVQVGYQNRSIKNVRKAMQFLQDGGLGDVYMAKGLCYKARDSFGKAEDSQPPDGFHYDLWIGPAEYFPYNEKKTHYNWHWHWATGNGDIGNQGPHQFDIARWGMGKNEHPLKISSSGGYYKFTDCSQETPNTQTATLEYADGKILQFEVRGLYTSGEAPLDVKIGNLFYGTEGWMEVKGSTWKTYFGRDNEPGPSSESEEKEEDGQALGYLAAPGGGGHYNNFIAAVRSRKKEDLTCDIEEGFRSSALPLLANISYRLGRNLTFDGNKEQFVNDKEADRMLSRNYRKPYVVPTSV
ncbi:MAG: Gfo/Idh/MocA family protein [Cyclobacteriaceae bacterium]